MHSNKEKEIRLYNVKEQIYKLLIDCDLNGFVSIYEKYSRLFGLDDLWKATKTCYIDIGDLWAQGKIDIAQNMKFQINLCTYPT